MLKPVWCVLLLLTVITLQNQSDADDVDDWNSLLTRYIALFNSRLKLDRSNLGQSAYLRELAVKRDASQKLAAEVVALIKKPQVLGPTRYMGIQLVLADKFSGRASDEALAVLLEHEMASPLLPELCFLIGFSSSSPAGEATLRALIEKSPDPHVVGMASLALSRLLRIKIDEVSALRHLSSRRRLRVAQFGEAYVEQLFETNVATARSEAAKLIATVENDYGDQTYDSSKLKTLASKERDYLESQTVGSPVRDIMGIDTNRTTFKLSDYDGRVRVLLFWGQWCAPCRAAYPTYRSLVAKYSSDEFAFLGVDSDKELSTIQKAIEDGDVTWRCWWDGVEEPMRIHSDWKLVGAPHIFVVDRKGYIRFVDVRGDELNQAVHLLVSEQI